MAKTSNKQNPVFRGVLLFGVILLALILMKTLGPQTEDAKKVDFTELLKMVELPEDDANRIVEMSFVDREIEAVSKQAVVYRSYGPPLDSELRSYLQGKGVRLRFAPVEEPGILKTILINLLPMILLIVLFIFIMRQLQIGGGKAMSFGKSRAKMTTDAKPKVTFADIAGIDEAKEELQEIIDFLKEPKKFTRLGGRIPKGVLLIGSPGTGKTILARGVAGEAGVPFFSISGSDFVEMFVGVGASRVRDLFEQAKKNAPCIIFIDEIDAVGRQRGAGLGGGHDEREQTLNQLLVEMDGFESNEGVIVIAASNRHDVLDPALLRPGRFDRRVVVPKPDVKGRKGILEVHSKKTPLSDDVDMGKIAQGTPGFSGADLENLVNEAALIAARATLDEVDMHHFELAKDKVLMGPERKSMVMNEEEKRNTAYHEAGHALVGLTVPGIDPVHKVSIIPRGQALGVTMLLPTEDRLSISKEYAEGMIAYAMGGRAAEELVFDRLTAGASDDISKASDIARQMVCKWGMSEKIGPLALTKREGEDVFLGRDLGSQQAYSDKVAEEIDKEIHRIVTSAYTNAKEILERRKDDLIAISEALLVRETLSRGEMDRIIAGEDIITEEEKKAHEERIKGRLEAAQEMREKSSSAGKQPGSAGLNTPLPQGS